MDWLLIHIILPLSVTFLGDEIKELFKKNKSLKRDLIKSYNKALKNWCDNSFSRYTTTRDFKKHYFQLENYLNTKVIPDNTLIIFWEDELRNYPGTYQFLIEQITTEILNKVDKIYKTNEVKPQQFDQVLDYIERYVSFEKDNDNLFVESPISKLIDVIVGDKDSNKSLFILYSSAQTGKTTELKNLAYHLQEKKNLQPFYYDLNNYRPNSHLYKFNYIIAENNNPILLLDAYDEIQDSEKNHFISEIRDITNDNPNTTILISSRLNFENENNFKEFTALYLEPLSRDNILKYIKDKYRDIYDTFLDRVVSLNVFNFLGTPFYLKEMLKYFNENKDLPKNKSDLYKILIDESFHIDEKHKQNKGSLRKLQTIGYSLLQKVAFVMSVSEKKVLSEKDLSDILPLDKDFQTICHFSIFKRDATSLTYSFEHIAFKEFLIADLLKSVNENKVEKLFFYPKSNILINSWYNIVILFIEIIQNSSEKFKTINEILITNNSQIIIDASPSFLNKKSRIEIFKKVYIEYKDKGLYIDYFEFRKKLMVFACFRETTLFLMEEINTHSFIANYHNALILLEYANYDEMNSQEVIQVKISMKEFLKKMQDKHELRNYILLPFNNKVFLNEFDIVEIREIIKHNRKAEVLRAFFELLLNLVNVDNYAEWIFDRQQYIRDYNHNGVTQMVYRYIVYEVYDKFTKTENILNSLQLVASEEHHYSREEEERKTIKKTLLEKLSVCYNITKDKNIIDSVLLAFIEENFNNYRSGECDVDTASVYRTFFNENNQSENILDKEYTFFEESLLNNKYDHRRELLMPLLMNESYFKIKMLSFKKSDLNGYYRMSKLLPFWNKDLSNNLKNEIDSYFTSPRPKQKDWNIEKQKDFDLVLDYQCFKQQIEYHCDNNCKKIYQQRIEYLSEDKISECIDSFFYTFTNNKQIDIASARKKVNNINFYSEFALLCITQYLNFDTEQTIIESSKEQKEIVCNFVDRTIKKGVNKDNLKAILASITFYEFDLTENQIEILLPFGYYSIPNHIGYKYRSTGKNDDFINFSNITILLDLLIYQSSSELINKKITQLIKSEKYYELILYRYFSSYIIKNKIKDLYKLLPTILFDKLKDSDVDLIIFKQKEILYEISKIEIGYNLIEDKFNSLPDECKIYFFSESTNKIDHEIICKELESIYNELKDENKTLCLSVLLRSGSKIALAEFIKYLKNNENISADKFPRLSYKGEESLDSLIDILDITLSKKHLRDNRFVDVVLYPIEEIAIANKENLKIVKERFEQIIEKHDDFHFLNRKIISMTEKLYESHKYNWTITQGIEMYNDLC